VFAEDVMSDDWTSEITLALQAAGQGQREAADRLVALVYDELRQVAAGLMKQERVEHTLQPTALVNEAFARIMDQDALKQATNRRYFFAAAARAMRQVLVDHARQRAADKRQGQRQRVPFEETLQHFEDQRLELLALNEALEELGRLNPRQAQIIDMRFFGGFTVPEVAELLSVSVSLVESDYRLARAFLRSRLSG
jgi:RNA polymerase sigma factor (TIGR02999 family)